MGQYPWGDDLHESLRTIVHEAAFERKCEYKLDRSNKHDHFRSTATQSFWIDTLVELLQNTTAIYTLDEILNGKKEEN